MVFTGGEPLLQLDEALLAAVHARGFEAAVETNGTQDPPPGSTGSASAQGRGAVAPHRGDELKLVYPQAELDRTCWPSSISGISGSSNGRPRRIANTESAVAHCLRDARWRLSLQTHKLIGIP